MKRLLPFIPILLLFLLNSCVGVLPNGTDPIGAAVAETLTAMSWTAMPTPTFNANIPTMINWLNNDLSTVSPLGRTMDAEYHVINVSFPNASNGSGLTFRVDVGCICMNDRECCLPERTFVVILETMYKKSNTTLAQVPTGISEIMVVCLNHQTRAQIGAISALWQDVDDYLNGRISGDQLGVRTNHIIAP